MLRERPQAHGIESAEEQRLLAEGESHVGHNKPVCERKHAMSSLHRHEKDTRDVQLRHLLHLWRDGAADDPVRQRLCREKRVHGQGRRPPFGGFPVAGHGYRLSPLQMSPRRRQLLLTECTYATVYRARMESTYVAHCYRVAS